MSFRRFAFAVPSGLTLLVACAGAGPANPHAVVAAASEPASEPTFPGRSEAPAPPPAPSDRAAATDAGAPAEDDEHLPDAAMSFDVRIPMRDGVTLSATIYRPAGGPAKLPVVYSLTPYVADTNHEWAVYLAKHGFAAAAVDIRGRGNSGGAFDPWHPHAHDLYDVVEWFARQPWSSGKVAMMGGSYLGMTQWWTARELPPHLTTIVPIAAVGLGIDFPMTKGIFMSYDARWLAYVGGRTKNTSVFGDEDLWRTRTAQFFEEKRPFRTLDAFLGVPSPAFQQMLLHPSYDAFWDSCHPTPAQYKAMREPVLTITGHFDGDQPGALHYYGEHLKYGAPEVTAEHYLVMGPWDHAGTRAPKADLGGLRFGPTSVVDMKKLVRDWYDWRMKDGKKPALLQDKVAYYVPGAHAEAWKYAPSLAAVTREHARFFLGSSRSEANDVFHSGTLARTAPDAAHSEPDAYVYDPDDVHDAEHARHVTSDENFLVSDDGLTDLHGAGLVYHSEPLPEEMELAGQTRLSVWLAMDVPDTDLAVDLYEVRPSGASVFLTQDHLRARYRESFAKESLVPAGVPQRYDFQRFSWFARRLAKGSRLRIVIHAVNELGYEKNYGTGGVVADESGKAARVAHVKLLHDAGHPAVLELPLGR